VLPCGSVVRQRRSTGNLPAETTSFVGRRRELAEVRKALAAARLVSLVGPGGVGKTRLAVRSTAGLGRGFADGAWWVELAEVRDPALVTSSVAAALDLRDQAATEPLQILLTHLRDRELLLLLDNCEHVLDVAAALVADILQAAPAVRVIVTSREPLQVQGEQVVPVPPLDLPPDGTDQPLLRLRQNEAVTLFIERASAASGAFALTASNSSAVVDLCRRLDGLPLAIELAAVRTRVLSVEQVRDRLTDRFALLTGGGRAALPRQQTLRTTIDWSHDLLTAAEQTLLRRLCVFAGRFTLDDVQSTCGLGRESDAPSLDLLAALVDKSLVVKEDAQGVACYRLHETMREYASLKLRDAGEVELLDEVFVEYYRTRSRDLRALLLQDIRVALSREVTPAFDARHSEGNRTAEWLDWVDLEIDNIRSALQKCVTVSDWRQGLELATSVGYYWVTRGTSESIRWFDDLLAAAAGSADISARAYHFRGWLSMLKSDPEAARPWFAQAIAAARVAGQPAQLSESLSAASIAEDMAGDRVAAGRLLDEAEAMTADVDHYPASIGLIQARASHALFDGDFPAAEAASAEGARLSREVGDLYYLERMLMNLGLVASAAGDLVRSKAQFTEGLRIAKDIDNRLGQASFLGLLGGQAVTSGNSRLGARLLGAAEAVAYAAGAGPLTPTSPGRPEPDPALARKSAMAALGTARFEAEYAAGRHLDREAALRLALGDPDAVGVDATRHVETGPLSPREAEVAGLIAEGLSNREIGARLFISERTVTTHVGNMLNKLGFDSRVQIANWMGTPDS
jgi:predicted ATPase/DNA-binding CsgD family transcriptional regulator